ncbi:MAG: glycosyltransferase family 2 protein [Candidatus Omnitrophica bacterium]|nr:glycosyltransferase family 2 protein [Candidatus Omnitrophota bacterium]
MTFLFWVSATILFYIYLGYPLLLWIWAKYFPCPVRASEHLPSVSVLLSAFNEEKVIAKKMENLLSLDYPEDKLEIFVGSDGSTDNTASILAQYEGERVGLVVLNERGGKPRMLNGLAEQARGEILVFTDARQKIDRQAIRHLVRNFSDPAVGCVSGELVLEGTNGSVAKGLGFYWNYEKFIRGHESQAGSVIGATGALYAIRRLLYHPMPEETILDDLYLPMKVVSQGYRTLFEGRAWVYDDVSSTPRQEYERKVRTLAGNYQSFVQFSSMLNPFRSRVALQFISHKLLRVLAPFFLIALFLSDFFLLHEPLYRIFFMLQIAFYGCATLGAVAPQKARRLFSQPYVFCLLNVSALVGLYRYLSRQQQVTWKTQ